MSVTALLALISVVVPCRADEFELIGSFPSLHYSYYTTMAVRGDHMAMGDQRYPGAALDIIDISDPNNLTLAGYTPTGHMIYELAWDGDYVYCPASWDGLYIYDVSDFGNISLVYDSTFGPSMSSVAVRGNTALCGSNAGLYVLDVSSPVHPVVISQHPDMAYFNIDLGDTIAYAFESYEEVLFINISDVRHPSLISRFPCPDMYGMAVDDFGHRLYAVSASWGLRIYDISNLFQPELISQTSLPGHPFDAAYSSGMPNRLIVSAYTGGMCALDISDPAHPEVTAVWDTRPQSNYVLVDKNVVYNTAADTLFAFILHREGVGIDEEPNLPSVPNLAQNYPNPFNAATTFTYSLPEGCHANLEVYNVLGRKVATLTDTYQNAGLHRVTWLADDQPSGVYFYRLRIDGGIFETRTMSLIK